MILRIARTIDLTPQLRCRPLESGMPSQRTVCRNERRAILSKGLMSASTRRTRGAHESLRPKKLGGASFLWLSGVV